MLVSIGAYNICDGTRSNGVALSELRLTGDRKFDVVDPLGQIIPIALDRIGRATDVSFQVKRSHGSLGAAEDFILGLESAIPATGTISVTTTGPSPATVTIPNGAIVEHSLVLHQGATTFHQYRIIGGAPM
jgi:hypothetical protein